MAVETPQEKKVIVGLNTDWENRVLEPGDYRYARNLHVGSSDDDNEGAGENLKGNLKVPFTSGTLPSGTNTTIGSYEDKQNKTIIYFVHNDQGSHGIYQYFPEIGDLGELQVLLIDSVLNFNKDSLITHTDLVDKKLLYWAEGSNPQRKVNIEKLNDYGKKSKFNIYFDTSQSSAFGGMFPINVFDPDGNPVIALDSFQLFIPNQSTKKEFVDEFVARGNAGGGSFFTLTACEEFIEVESVGTGNENGVFQVEIGDDNSGTNIKAITVPQNYYPKTAPAGSTKIGSFKEEFIDAIKYPPHCEPQVEYMEDTDVETNFVRNSVFQFRTRYYYDDNEKSALGPISIVPDDKIPCGNDPLASTNNFIELDYEDIDGRLTDPSSLTILKKIELFVRITNEGKFKSITVIEQQDFGIISNIFKFFNDGNYTVIANALSNKLFDAIPDRSETQAFIKNRIDYANNTEGYECPCPELEFEVDIDDTEPTAQKVGAVTGKIRIGNRTVNNADFRFNQPIWRRDDTHEDYAVFGGFGKSDHIKNIDSEYGQQLPEGGFTVYLAGTPHFAISNQNIGTNGVQLDEKFGSGRTQGGNGVYDADKFSYRRDIVDTIEDHECFSTFTIPNVKPGKYIVRVASHWCSFGDKLSKGSLYDLDNGLAWQRTSTYVRGVNGQDLVREIEIEVTAGATVNVGEFLLEDLSDPRLLTSSTAWSGYLMDAEASGDLGELAAGVSMELQSLVFAIQGFLTFDPNIIPDQLEPIVTDHNGFWFASLAEINLFNFNEPYRVAAMSISGDPSDPSPGYTKTNAGVVTNREVIRQWADTMYEGNIAQLIDGVNLPSTDRLHKTSDHRSYILFNTNRDVTDNCRTLIEGKVIQKGCSACGVAGISVLVAKTNRFEFTKEEGEFSILVYGNAALNQNNRPENVIISYDGLCVVDIEDNLRAINPQFDDNANGTTTFNNTIPLESGEYNMSIISDEIISSFKRGGKYDAGIIYLERGNRGTTVCRKSDTDFYIPFYTEDLGGSEPIKLGRPIVQWQINHQPPEFATHYQWVRTKNLLYNRFIQFAIDEAEYHVDADSITTFAAGNAREIYIELSFTKYRSENSGADVGFTPEVGDRMRFILDENGEAFDGFFDLEIRELRGASYIIALNESLPELKPGMLVELYTPKLKDEQKVFYEFGECFQIDNPHTPQRAHSVTSGAFTSGDIWVRPRNIPFDVSRKQFTVEDQSLSDFFESKDESIGRINIEDPDSGRIERPTNLRFSNKFVPGTKINGLNSFEGLNSSDEVPRDGQAIRKLAVVGNILLAVAERNTYSIYVEEALFTDKAGQQVVAISDQVIGSVRTLIGEYGTLNPESFVEEKHRAFFWDRYRGVVVQYAQDGLTAVSGNRMKDHFSDLGKVQRYIPDLVAWGTYDREFHEYILTTSGATIIEEGNTNTVKLPAEIVNDAADNPRRTSIVSQGIGGGMTRLTATINQETVAYSADLDQPASNRWTTFYSYLPEAIGKSGLLLVTFKDGEVWLHNVNDKRNTFYGVFSPSQIQIVGNSEQSRNKVWQSVSLESNLVWATPTDGINNGGSQISELSESDFIKREAEGDFHAAFLRDKNTPNVANPLIEGDNIRGKVVEILLENKSEEFCKLFAVNFYYLASELSNA